MCVCVGECGEMKTLEMQASFLHPTTGLLTQTQTEGPVERINLHPEDLSFFPAFLLFRNIVFARFPARKLVNTMVLNSRKALASFSCLQKHCESSQLF